MSSSRLRPSYPCHERLARRSLFQSRHLLPHATPISTTLLTFAVLHSSMATSTVAAMGGDGDARGATQLKYNGTGATGANPLEMDVNIWYEVSFYPALPFPPSPSPLCALPLDARSVHQWVTGGPATNARKLTLCARSLEISLGCSRPLLSSC